MIPSAPGVMGSACADRMPCRSRWLLCHVDARAAKLMEQIMPRSWEPSLRIASSNFHCVGEYAQQLEDEAIWQMFGDWLGDIHPEERAFIESMLDVLERRI